MRNNNLKSIINFIDKISSYVPIKPNTDSILQTIFQLYELIFNDKPDRHFLSSWKKLIDSSTSFRNFWKEFNLWIRHPKKSISFQ